MRVSPLGRSLRASLSTSYSVLKNSRPCFACPSGFFCALKGSSYSQERRVRIIYFVPHEVMMMNMFGRCVAMSLLMGALLSLTGCNTIAGVGEDITGSARTVQHAL